MKKIAAGLILLCVSCFSSCNYDKDLIDSQHPQEYIESFFSTIKDKNANQALDNLFATNKWLLNDSKNDIDNVKLQLSNAINIVGEYNESEIIFYDEIGKSLSIYSYLVKYDKQPLRFTFIFYKADDKWRLHNFQFDTNVIDELSKKSKIYLLDNHS